MKKWGRMTKWLVFALVLTTPCFAGKLKGTVVSDEGRPLSGARIVIFHDMALLVLQQGTSDRNGQYFFTLEPGPYRIYVLKKGYQPFHGRTLVVHERDTVVLVHKLEKEVALSESKSSLKDILRRSNLKPDKKMNQEFLIARDLELPQTRETFRGSVQTESRQSLQGNLEQFSSVRVKTQLAHGMALESSMTSSNHDHYANPTTQIQAGVSVNLNQVALDISAESIRLSKAVEPNRSKAVSISGDYGTGHQSSTSLSMVQSLRNAEEQESFSLVQKNAFQMAGHQLVNQARYTTWETNGIEHATKADLKTQWKPDPGAKLGLQTDVDYLNLDQGTRTAAKVWLTGDHMDPQERFAIESKIGLRKEQQDEEWVQKHQITAQTGAVELQAHYSQDCNFNALAARDLFGSYLQNPQTPYSNESFYKTTSQAFWLQSRLIHSQRWHSQLKWSRHQDTADLLYAGRPEDFKTEAGHSRQILGYSLHAPKLGARLELNHAQNQSDEVRFETSELVYGQSLNPFRNKAMALLIEFRMKNNPTIPAWWLLQEMAWKNGQLGTMYEGQLSLQF